MKSDINFVMKTWSARILLTVTVIIMVLAGSFPARGSIQNNSVQHLVSNSPRSVTVTKPATQPAEEKSNISAVVGSSITLRYPWQKQSTLLTVWNVKLINGTNCHLSYMSIKNLSDTNCTENINWFSRPDQEYALLIKPVQIFNEGFYKCSSSINEGTFFHEYALTVLVPPQVLLTYGSNGTAVCVAAAGKPAAQVSWGLKRDSSTVKKMLANGTETIIISTYNVTSAEENNLTCHISHPAWSNSLVLSLKSGRNGEKLKDSKMPLLYSVLGVILGIILILLFIYLSRLLYGKYDKDLMQREADTSKSPETISRPSIQENEMEPYATFVQKENVIYDTTFDASVSKHFPPGLSLST
ncbi:PREDICTED: cell surface glycoprotein CD200 receptor 1 [Gekko japonicus]|uniref:Cell surface glycoprotein CD200 receptor 1 n=1 Tax=Gekko japonicus TaxID=146911 RepID=A0ABM1JZA1_GEKJA|nr:PREDICTED: cell surface glycoprotein CD200 receptor 1 [Gekko japonicus]